MGFCELWYFWQTLRSQKPGREDMNAKSTTATAERTLIKLLPISTSASSLDSKYVSWTLQVSADERLRPLLHSLFLMSAAKYGGIGLTAFLIVQIFRCLRGCGGHVARGRACSSGHVSASTCADSLSHYSRGRFLKHLWELGGRVGAHASKAAHTFSTRIEPMQPLGGMTMVIFRWKIMAHRRVIEKSSTKYSSMVSVIPCW